MLQNSHPSSNIPLYNHIMETNSACHDQSPSSTVTFNLNNQHDQQLHLINSHYDPIQHMFEKPLTPSDVGKLNRLVIPKQHAEKHFPLDRNQGSVLMSFQDEYRKLWRFRYSYWNSSQSYVFTKGWSRFVKEKRLDVGDVVLFQRHMLDCNKMFIGWRRRAQPIAGGGADQSSYPLQHVPLALPHTYHELDHAGVIYEHVDAYQRGMVTTRRLRLFGVNLECPADSEPSTTYGSSQGDHQYNFNSDNSHHNM